MATPDECECTRVGILLGRGIESVACDLPETKQWADFILDSMIVRFIHKVPNNDE